MNCSRTLVRLGAIAVAFTLFFARSSADTITQTALIDFSTADEITGTGSFRQFNVGSSSIFTGTFNPFDTSLGELESITLAWTINASGTFTGATRYQISTSGGLSLAGVSYSGTGMGNGNSTGTVGYTITPTSTFYPATMSSVLLERLTGDDAFVAQFGSALLLDFDAFTGTESYTAAVSGNIMLTYNYTAATAAIPEPSTYALAFGALSLGFVALRRRNRSKIATA